MPENTRSALQKFVAWTKVKFRLHTKNDSKTVYFHEREIWWCSLGVNIGYEQDGKNDNFERPALILKKFNKDLLWILPLTSKKRAGKYYYRVSYKGRFYLVILSQIRAVSSKRLLRKIRRLPKSSFMEIKKELRKFL